MSLPIATSARVLAFSIVVTAFSTMTVSAEMTRFRGFALGDNLETVDKAARNLNLTGERPSSKKRYSELKKDDAIVAVVYFDQNGIVSGLDFYTEFFDAKGINIDELALAIQERYGASMYEEEECVVLNQPAICFVGATLGEEIRVSKSVLGTIVKVTPKKVVTPNFD